MKSAIRILTIIVVAFLSALHARGQKEDASALVRQTYIAAIDSACTSYANYEPAKARQWLELARGLAYDSTSSIIVKCLDVRSLTITADNQTWRDSLQWAYDYMMRHRDDSVSVYGCAVANWMMGWYDMPTNAAGAETRFEIAANHLRTLGRSLMVDNSELMRSEAMLAQSHIVESNELTRRMVEQCTRAGNHSMRFMALMQQFGAYTTLNMLDMAEQISNTIEVDGWYKNSFYSELRYLRRKAHFLLSASRHAEAEALVPRMEMLRELLNRNSETWRTELLIAKLYLYQGKVAEAEPHVEACEEVLTKMKIMPYNNYQSPHHLLMMQAYIALSHGQIDKAERLVDQIVIPQPMTDAHDFVEPYYELRERICIARGSYRDAISYLRKRNETNDSLLRVNINQRTRDTELSYANDTTIVRQHAEYYAQQKDIENKRLQVVLSVLLAILLIAMGVMIHTMWLRRRDKAGMHEETERHLLLEQEVRQQTQTLKRQNELLGEENLDNLRSHAYAKHIQQGILPPPTVLNTYLGTEGSFVLFQPKGLISGDFYWFKRLNSGRVVTCCADSWGSDAQGAMMAAASIMVLNDAIADDAEQTAAGIMRAFNSRLLSMLPGIKSLEGVNCTIAIIDTEAHTINVSMARQRAILSHGGEMQILRGVNRKVGEVAHPFIDRKYADIYLDYAHGDTLYLLTDGTTSIFGGAKGDKLKMSGLTSILREAEAETPDKRQLTIRRLLTHWAGNYPKSDDVTLIGLSL